MSEAHSAQTKQLPYSDWSIKSFFVGGGWGGGGGGGGVGGYDDIGRFQSVQMQPISEQRAD